MSRLRDFFRLSSLRDELEAGMLLEENRSLFLDDHVDDGRIIEIRSRLYDVSSELSSFARRNR
jgi:hypothetical protein